MIKKATQNKVFQKDTEQIIILSSQGVKFTKKTAALLGAEVGTQVWYGWDEANDIILYLDNEHRGKLNSKLVLNIGGLNNALLEKTGLDKIEGHRADFAVSELKDETDGTNTIQVAVLTLKDVKKITPEEAVAETGDEAAPAKGSRKNQLVSEPASVE